MFDGVVFFMQIATELNDKIKQDGLSDVGNLEQDFVYGDASSKELINILNTKQVGCLSVRTKSSSNCVD